MTFLFIFRYSTRRARLTQRSTWVWSLLAPLLTSVAPVGHAQDLNWEGQTEPS